MSSSGNNAGSSVDLAGLAQTLPSLPAPATPEERLYFFYSFDLVNSTKYKTFYPNDWPDTIDLFYRTVIQEIDKWGAVSPPRVWKFVGDEVLMYQVITCKKDMVEAPAEGLRTVRDTTKRIREGVEHKGHHLLAVKGTVWCAVVSEAVRTQDEKRPRNVTSKPLSVKSSLLNNVPSGLDFLGPDIDSGFRAGKCAAPNRLAVAPGLAYLVSEIATTVLKDGKHTQDETRRYEALSDQLRIVVFSDEAKGVWFEQHFPVLWFEDDWSKVDDSFRYDEDLTNKIVKQVKGKVDGLKRAGFLSGVYRDAGQEREIHDLLRIAGALPEIAEPQPLPEPEPSGVSLRRAEVHCVAICVDPSDRVLCRRRSETKATLPGIWDFGCSQLRLNQDFSKAIHGEYLSDFSVAATLLEDPPLPLTTYSFVNGDGYMVPGIIFPAMGEGADLSAKPGDEAKWMSIAEIEALDDDACVPNFKANAKAARDRVRAARASAAPLATTDGAAPAHASTARA